MEMGNDEICRRFREAKDKNQQIEILADLNACSTQEILDILSAHGEISGLPKKKPDRRGAERISWNGEARRELLRLREEEQLSWDAIGERMGCSGPTAATAYRRAKEKQKKFASGADLAPDHEKQESPTVKCSDYPKSSRQIEWEAKRTDLLQVMFDCLFSDIFEEMDESYLTGAQVDYANGRLRLSAKVEDVRVSIQVAMDPLHGLRREEEARE